MFDDVSLNQSNEYSNKPVKISSGYAMNRLKCVPVGISQLMGTKNTATTGDTGASASQVISVEQV